ncbi:TOM1-like protein 2 isoform X2 [Cylas formicarius]|uniref:TOM1-like protein 2 isoform X2 n=1 Tax=Cylas formicarius TaxID=197179 RepID=UPI0029586BB3|nr:TOM1-like protein 2 isoform X2 [Cylas formicarius]
MSFLQNALIGNPFSTPVGSKIEQATDGSLASENWALNMEICDIINETEEGPKDAIRAIRKRLSQNAGKNYTVIMYTLTILETCVKNCGKRFHALACGKDFVQELVKLLSPKNDPPTAVQEKVLSLIQSWAGAFQSDPDLAGVAAVYKDLLAKGIEFPPTDLDSMAPIHTPRKSVVGAPPPAEPSSSPPPPAAASQGVLTPEQRAKLQSELDVVQSNMCVLGEMLGEAEPGREHPDEVALLKELRVTCDGMQRRLVDLIGKIANDSLTEELLRINDDMNNLFLRYGRWEKNRGATPSALVAAAIPPSTSARATPPAAGDSLIDFDDDVADAVSKLVVAEGGDGRRDEEFDMFAQSRTATYESSKRSGSTYRDNLEPDQVAGGLSSLANSRPASGPEESVTSSDFERFLAERAAAADTLPTVTATTGSTNPSEARKSDKKRPDLLTS